MTVTKHGKMIITLESDLCVSSGYSYAGIVDSDSCYDECGIPYIPGRRLKGCLRETADTLLISLFTQEQIEAVFGKSGSDKGSSFRIDNAYIENYETIKEFIENHKVCSPQEILERFTHVVGQTRIENGVADEGSLRYTRVVNRFFPLSSQGDGTASKMVFISCFTCEEDDWNLICMCAQGTRHIGLKRNRGFGNVQIRIEEAGDSGYRKEDFLKEDFSDGDNVTISYAVKNVQPLMLSRTEEDETIDYIPGQQVLGVMAGTYLSAEGKRAETEEFRDLFLNGRGVFSHLYPYDGEEIYYPAPDYLNRLKKSKDLVSNLKEELSQNPENDSISQKPDYGNQPKKLKREFVAGVGEEVTIYEIKKDVVYHHSHRNEKLYGLETIRRGQMFAGTITVPKRYEDVIKDLLQKADLRFGKSKTAQYGKCELVPCKKCFSDLKAEGTDLVVTFLSDTIITDQNGTPIVFRDEVKGAVAKTLGFEEVDPTDDEYISSIQTTLVTGYMNTWNLRRAPIPAVKAGSYLVFHLKTPLKVDHFLIGERTLEGYGHIGIRELKDLKAFREKKASDGTVSIVENETAKKLMIPIIYDRWLDRKINDALSESPKVNVTNTAAGRFMLMLKESINEAEKGSDYADETLRLFKERIGSIKSDSTRSEGLKLIKRIEANESFVKADEELIGDLKKIGGANPSDNEMKIRWPRYLMAILTDRKYQGR